MTWRTTRLKYLAAAPIANGLGEAAQDSDPSWPRYIRTTDIASARHLHSDRRVSLPPEVARRSMVQANDLLMCAAGSLGKVYLHQGDEPACYAGYLVRFRPRLDLVEPRFVAYWSESQPFLDQIAVGAVRSTIDNFSAGKYQQMELSLPSLDEQRRIADFLDAETARIDRLLGLRAMQQTLTLERFRATLVAETLDREVGKATRLKNLFEFERNGLWGDEPQGDDDDVPVVRVADFDRENFRVGRFDTIRSVPWRLRQRRLLRPGDLLLEKSGGTEDKPVGCAVIFDHAGPAICSNFVAALRPNKDFDATFVGYLMAAHYQTRRNAPFVKQTTGIQNLDSGAYLGLHVVVPERSGQIEAVQRIEHARTSASSLMSLQRRNAELLVEARTATITAAVMGDLDVTTARGAA